MSFYQALICFILSFSILMTSCSQNQSSSKEGGKVSVVTPKVLGPPIDAGSIPPRTGRLVKLSNGAEIYVQKRNGVLVYTAEGTYSNDSFSSLKKRVSSRPPHEKSAYIQNEIEKIFTKLKQIKGVGIKQYPELGYFTFELPYEPDLMGKLKTLDLPHQVFVNPVAFDGESMKTISSMKPSSEGMTPKFNPRDSAKDFSGLDRLRVSEFLKLAQAAIGGEASVNGSSVRVGITDTGITFNHPTFLSPNGEAEPPRVVYMKDFTREGRVYFNPNAKFQVLVPEGAPADQLTLNAQVLYTPKLPDIPSGDDLIELKDLTIQVSPELKAILTQPGSGAKLGFINEEVFQSKEDAVDLSADGNVNHMFFVIYIPGKAGNPDVIYVDTSGTADFRTSKPIGDWNRTEQTMKIFAEKIGFDFREENLPSSKGPEKIPVRSVSIVGYDPGNHGSHVAGIIGGSQASLARGVAPESILLMNRVCSNNAGCNASAGFVDLALKGGAEVINMSLGGLSPFNDGFGVQETLVNRIATEYNILFVISAGNSGPGRQTVGSPSTARLSLSVGATATRDMIQRQYEWPGSGALSSFAGSNDDIQDFIFFFSSRGPTASGGFKPNVTAPGTELSSVQLNAAAGTRGGLDVYWGTSMAAPAATGAYALLLDAIKKYNKNHPETPLTTDALVLRQVLISSARPFDVSRFNPETGEKLQGQYTWIDQGTGMIDLVAAWKKVFELRDSSIPSSIGLPGKQDLGIELDYPVFVKAKGPNQIPYDGSTTQSNGTPSFGVGLYLDYFKTDTLYAAYVGRRIPDGLMGTPLAGDLTRQLETTKDEFVLKTYIYGSDQPWVKAGVLNQLGEGSSCANASTANLWIIGEGVVTKAGEDGKGALNPLSLSALNICVDRKMIAKDLKPGDHGALILGHRVVNGKVAVLPSFTVPVYLTIPHQTLANSTAYSIQGKVESFEVKRNYVMIPKGTTLVRVQVEVPALEPNSGKYLGEDQFCSGVELMSLVGSNVSKPFKTRAAAQISNCNANGGIETDETKRKLSFTLSNPKSSIWDLAIFGSYKFLKSQYEMRVDYLMASSDVEEIKGGIDALTGSVKLTIQEASFNFYPDLSTSTYELQGLVSEVRSQVQNKGSVYVPNPQGMLRTYGDLVKEVTLATHNSPGNDIDLYVYQCPNTVKEPSDPSCVSVGKSDGPTDEESVTFKPQSGKVYVAKVVGAGVNDQGQFSFTETLLSDPEKGKLSISRNAGAFDVQYSMSPEQLGSSLFFNNELFKSAKYGVKGALTLRGADKTVIKSIPVRIN
jgi:subtilisin family serine protease